MFAGERVSIIGIGFSCLCVCVCDGKGGRGYLLVQCDVVLKRGR